VQSTLTAAYSLNDAEDPDTDLQVLPRRHLQVQPHFRFLSWARLGVVFGAADPESDTRFQAVDQTEGGAKVLRTSSGVGLHQRQL
jgi:hypothetical protein